MKGQAIAIRRHLRLAVVNCMELKALVAQLDTSQDMRELPVAFRTHTITQLAYSDVD
jgi:hypothetical protein